MMFTLKPSCFRGRVFYAPSIPVISSKLAIFKPFRQAGLAEILSFS
jgi:hypothetical protein